MSIKYFLYLELVDELINDLPEPLVGKLEVDGDLGGEDVVEQLAVVVVRLEPLVDSGAALHPVVILARLNTKRKGKFINL